MERDEPPGIPDNVLQADPELGSVDVRGSRGEDRRDESTRAGHGTADVLDQARSTLGVHLRTIERERLRRHPRIGEGAQEGHDPGDVDRIQVEPVQDRVTVVREGTSAVVVDVDGIREADERDVAVMEEAVLQRDVAQARRLETAAIRHVAGDRETTRVLGDRS